MTTNRQEVSQNRLGPEIQEMKQQCKTLQLATVDVLKAIQMLVMLLYY